MDMVHSAHAFFLLFVLYNQIIQLHIMYVNANLFPIVINVVAFSTDFMCSMFYFFFVKFVFLFCYILSFFLGK